MSTPDATPAPAVDPAVKLPDHVAAQAAAADAAHKAAYTAPQETSVPSVTPAASTPEPAPPPEPSPAPAPAADGSYPDKGANLTPDQWRHQYLSMKGRYEQATQSIGILQEQMTELGDELQRTQKVVQRRPAQPVRPRAPLVTEKDVETFGPDVLDMVARVARNALTPDLQKVHTGVQEVSKQVQQSKYETVYDTLDREVPDWRAINVSARFKSWCGLRDIYAGQLRGRLLNDALQAADAPRAVAFFKGFLSEEQATGALPSSPDLPPIVAARDPALTLASLAAPGRAKPAGGDGPTPVEKPIFTRVQIKAFYDAVRSGYFVGREAEKAATEQALFAAQREGRVR